jgi:hypothetical protein
LAPPAARAALPNTLSGGSRLQVFDAGALSFGYAQAAYALSQLCGLYGYAAVRLRQRRGATGATGGGSGVGVGSDDFPLTSARQLLPCAAGLAAEGAGGAAGGGGGGGWLERVLPLGARARAEAMALTRQSVLRHALTEADKLVLLGVGETAQQPAGLPVLSAHNLPRHCGY